jgi:Lipid A core - O-antigen ligase and related enzymes
MTAPIARRGRFVPARASAAAARLSGGLPLLAGIRWTPSYAAFLLYIFNIVTYRLPVGTGTIAMTVALVMLPLEHRPLRLPPVVLWTTALLGWGFIGWTTTTYPDVVWNWVVEFSKIVGVMVVAVNVLTTRARLRLFLVAFLGFFAFYPVRGALITYFAYGGGPGGRAGWNYVYENPNDLAGMCVLVFSLAVGMLVSDRKTWIRACAFAGALLLPLVILLTQSRGAFLAMLAIVAIALKGFWRRGRVILGAAVAIALLAVLTPDSVWQRLGTIRDVTSTEDVARTEAEGSARQRLEIWKVASTIFAENPLTGVGMGAYPRVHYLTSQRPTFNPIAGGARDAHSTYLNLLAETGLPGFLLFCGVIGAVVIDAERTRRRARGTGAPGAMQLFYLELGLFGYLVAGIWGTYGQLVLTYLHIALISAAAQVLKNELSPSQPPRMRTGGAPTPAMARAAVPRRRR